MCVLVRREGIICLSSLSQVTIVPREKYPMGHTVLKVNEQRELTNMFTRRYLEEQLLMVLAGEGNKRGVCWFNIVELKSHSR
jgi:hypothetical protein